MGHPRVALLGTGYWANFQVASWQALGVPVVAVWNRTRERADAFAARWGIPRVFDTPESLMSWGQFDLADVITDVDGHEPLVTMAARRGIAVICQKPMSGTLESCRRMVQACADAGVWFAVHENFRYQPPIVAFKQALQRGVCGRLEQAHLLFRSPNRAIMEKQPALKSMDHMALRDMGPHGFDVVRYLFGEIEALSCLPLSAYTDLPVMTGALSLLRTDADLPVQCDLVHEWPYRIYVRGDAGTLMLDSELLLHTVTAAGESVVDTKTWVYLPYIPQDEWQLHGGHVYSSIPACLADLLDAFERGVPAATSGADNYRTMRAVFGAIASVDEGRTVVLADLG